MWKPVVHIFVVIICLVQPKKSETDSSWIDWRSNPLQSIQEILKNYNHVVTCVIKQKGENIDKIAGCFADEKSLESLQQLINEQSSKHIPQGFKDCINSLNGDSEVLKGEILKCLKDNHMESKIKELIGKFSKQKVDQINKFFNCLANQKGKTVEENALTCLISNPGLISSFINQPQRALKRQKTRHNHENHGSGLTFELKIQF